MIVFVLILGLILRLISLNQSFWIDEATSALTTKMSLMDFFGKFMPGDFHPPLYYIALRAWETIFGTSEIALRSLSVLFGIATIYVIYLIGKELINKEAGIIASLFLATSGLHIYYSQEARMYSMSACLVSLAVYLFVKKKWGFFALVIGLIGITDYLPLLILPVFWICCFFDRKNIKKLIWSHIVLVILALVWSPIFIKQLTSGINVTSSSPAWVNVLGKFSIKEILLIPVKFIIGRVSFDNKFIYAFVVGIGFVVFGYLILRALKSWKKLKIIWIWLTIPLILALIISIKLPILNYFRFLFILPAIYLLAASGVTTLKKKWQIVFISLILVINLVTSGIYLFNQKFQREDWRSLASEIKANPQATIVFPTKSQHEGLIYYGVDLDKKWTKEVWLVRYAQEISDPSDMTRQKLEGLGYTKNAEEDFNGVVVWKYFSHAKID